MTVYGLVIFDAKFNQRAENVFGQVKALACRVQIQAAKTAFKPLTQYLTCLATVPGIGNRQAGEFFGVRPDNLADVLISFTVAHNYKFVGRRDHRMRNPVFFHLFEPIAGIQFAVVQQKTDR